MSPEELTHLDSINNNRIVLRKLIDKVPSIHALSRGKRHFKFVATLKKGLVPRLVLFAEHNFGGYNAVASAAGHGLVAGGTVGLLLSDGAEAEAAFPLALVPLVGTEPGELRSKVFGFL